MQKDQEEFEKGIQKQKSALDDLGDLEKQLQAREDRR
jgi:hypothetical protein